jgi:hypothetical protein
VRAPFLMDLMYLMSQKPQTGKKQEWLKT